MGPPADLRVGKSLSVQDEVACRTQLRIPIGGKKGVRMADRFRLRPSEYPDGGRIPYMDRAGGVADDHRQGGRLDQGVKSTAGFPERVFGACPLREVVLDRIQHDVVRPHQRRELVSPGIGIEPRSGIFPDGLQRFTAQAVQRPDEQEGESASNHRYADQEDETPLGHLGTVHREEILDDAGVRLDHEAKLFVDDPDRHVGIRTVILPVHVEDGSLLLEAALRQQGIECLGETDVVGSRNHVGGGCKEHLAARLPGDLLREVVVDAVPEEQHPRGLGFPENVDRDDRPGAESIRGGHRRYDLVAFQCPLESRHSSQFSLSRHPLLSRAVQDVPVDIGHDEDLQVHLRVELVHRRLQRPCVSPGSAVMKEPVHDVRIVFQDLRKTRDPVHFRGDDGFDRQMDIPGLVSLPFLEYRVKDGFVDVVASGEDAGPDEEQEQHDRDGDGVAGAQFTDSGPDIAKDFRNIAQTDPAPGILKACSNLSAITLRKFNLLSWADYHGVRA